MDKQFTTGGGGDSLTGEDRPMNVWTNGNATSFEDRLTGDVDSNDVVIGVKENIDWTAANGGPGSSYLTSKAASKTNAYVDVDVDGFMKLGDIRGEFSPSRQVDRDPSENVDRDPGDNIVGTAIARDHNHGKRSNWDAICDVGTSIKQTSIADALTNYHPVDAQMGELRSDHIGAFKTLNETTNFRPQQGANTSIVHLEHDAADTTQIGALKPSHVRSVAASADNDSIVYLEEDAIVGNTGANPFSELDQGFVAAPVNEIRSENRFVIEPINLFQGLDAGGMNDAEAIGMDSSTVDVMNNVISSLQPANEFI